jgi:hypothetical protein
MVLSDDGIVLSDDGMVSDDDMSLRTTAVPCRPPRLADLEIAPRDLQGSLDCSAATSMREMLRLKNLNFSFFIKNA